jgi:serine/threonine protein kinase
MLQLNHENVIKLYWTFQTSKELFFVMELCTGGELFYHLQVKETFTEPQAKFYISQVVKAISHLHERGIVYRDLKPENLLVDEHGNLKLADFGLSKHVKDGQSFSFCGSPEYIAPEMLKGQGHGKAMDVF